MGTKISKNIRTSKKLPHFLSLSDFNVTFYIVSYLGEISLHALGILIVNDLQKLFQFRTNLRHLVMGIRKRISCNR